MTLAQTGVQQLFLEETAMVEKGVVTTNRPYKSLKAVRSRRPFEGPHTATENSNDSSSLRATKTIFADLILHFYHTVYHEDDHQP